MGPVYAQLQVPVAEDLRNIWKRGRLVVLVAMGSSANRRPVLDVSHSASRTDVEIISPSAVYLSDADRETLPATCASLDGFQSIVWEIWWTSR